ncbi:hypothetical protein PVAP13_8KG213700 [Panicum virgatum]|uniref:Uncharacterized protein n=1 Tax=Panicum virgatum TaxID=38727 RepID=A0A8T0PIK9_PANVG|nr:hypothetical protein PVAP13_8KG213700 [Panicum virgatum]
MRGGARRVTAGEHGCGGACGCGWQAFRAPPARPTVQPSPRTRPSSPAAMTAPTVPEPPLMAGVERRWLWFHDGQPPRAAVLGTRHRWRHCRRNCSHGRLTLPCHHLRGPPTRPPHSSSAGRPTRRAFPRNGERHLRCIFTLQERKCSHVPVRERPLRSRSAVTVRSPSSSLVARYLRPTVSMELASDVRGRRSELARTGAAELPQSCGGGARSRGGAYLHAYGRARTAGDVRCPCSPAPPAGLLHPARSELTHEAAELHAARRCDEKSWSGYREERR